MKASVAKLQLRLTLDAGMDEFFLWLLAKPVKQRARELITMARIGWAMTHGRRVPGFAGDESAAVRHAGTSTRSDAGEPAAADAASAEGPSLSAAVATFGRSFLTARPPA